MVTMKEENFPIVVLIIAKTINRIGFPIKSVISQTELQISGVYEGDTLKTKLN